MGRHVVKGGQKKKKAEPSLAQQLDGLRPEVDEATLAKLSRGRPKKAAGRRQLALTEPQVHEPTKNLLLCRGNQCSLEGQQLLKDLHALRKPYCVLLNRKQTRLLAPMQDPSDFEFLGRKNLCATFIMASTTKKHPLRIFAGRLFDFKLYDLYEFDVIDYKPMDLGKSSRPPVEGSKPLVIFQGGLWDANEALLAAKNCLADIFGGIKAEKIAAERFDSAVICTAFEKGDAPAIRVDYANVTLTRGEAADEPVVDLVLTGPTFTLRPLGSKLPERDRVKAATTIPQEEFAKGKSSVKTVTNDLLETRQQVHIVPESTATLYLKHGKN